MKVQSAVRFHFVLPLPRFLCQRFPTILVIFAAPIAMFVL
jgi:hypothetical protein